MDMSFNTSHVNVYLKQREESEGKRSFNTSYVNVYPQGGMVQNRIGGVSIHPMLMFIKAQASQSAAAKSFQYILC